MSNNAKIFKALISLTVVAMMIGVTTAWGDDNPAKLDKVTFRLNYFAQGSHAPVFYGADTGIFKKHNIDIAIGEGKGSGSTVSIVASKGDMIGYADAGTIFALIAKGAPVKVIAPVYSKLSSAVISLAKTGINKPGDIVAKKIGITEGDGPAKLFDAFLKNAGISRNQLTVIAMDPNSKVPALLNGQVDAILGGFDDQPFVIKAKGQEPSILAYADYGVQAVGMVLVAHNDTITGNPDLLKRFIKAYAESWAEAYKHPDEALQSLFKKFPDLMPDTAKNQLNAGFGLLISSHSRGICNVDDKLFTESIVVFKNYMGLDAAIRPESLYTRDFFPANAPQLTK